MICSLFHIDFYQVESLPFSHYTLLIGEGINLMRGLSGLGFDLETQADKELRMKEEVEALREQGLL